MPGSEDRLPRQLSSLEFPHRNADAYLRDARLEDEDFPKTDLGKAIFGATPNTCGRLMAWFPQALLFGFWQSHMGRKRQITKPARAWVSEIVGWNLAATDTRVMGLKGDPLNLNLESDQLGTPTTDELGDRWRRRRGWQVGQALRYWSRAGAVHGRRCHRGGGFVFPRDPTGHRVVCSTPAHPSGVGPPGSGHGGARPADGAGFVCPPAGLRSGVRLRSGAELRPRKATTRWLGSSGEEGLEIGDAHGAARLLEAALAHALSVGVPLDGWNQPPTILTPKDNLSRAIRATWPDLDEDI